MPDVASVLLAAVTVGSSPDVVDAERAAGADIADSRATAGPIAEEDVPEEALLDAVMLASGSTVTSDARSVRGVVESIRDQLLNQNNVVVGRGNEPVNEFTANDALLYGSFPCLFIFGVGLGGRYGVSERDTRHMLLQYVLPVPPHHASHRVGGSPPPSRQVIDGLALLN